MCTREILTLQFGHYSNYVGAHWWNIQETGFEYNSPIPNEINHDVLFREGINDKVKQHLFTLFYILHVIAFVLERSYLYATSVSCRFKGQPKIAS